MKRILIIAALLGAGYYAFGKSSPNAATGSATEENDDYIFVKYDERIIIDKNGRSIYVKDGKLYAVVNDLAYQNWKLRNPGIDVANVDEDIWDYYLANDPKIIGGTIEK